MIEVVSQKESECKSNEEHLILKQDSNIESECSSNDSDSDIDQKVQIIENIFDKPEKIMVIKDD